MPEIILVSSKKHVLSNLRASIQTILNNLMRHRIRIIIFCAITMIFIDRDNSELLTCISLHLNWMPLLTVGFQCVPAGKSLGLALGHSPLCLTLGLLMQLAIVSCSALICPGPWPHCPLWTHPPHLHDQDDLVDLGDAVILLQIGSTSGFIYGIHY